jgi:hypothetical protein
MGHKKVLERLSSVLSFYDHSGIVVPNDLCRHCIYINISGHTAGFLGLQAVLIMVACTNVWFLTETKMEYGVLGGLRGTRVAAFTYLVSNLGISSIKSTSLELSFLAKVILIGPGNPSEIQA